ncbi:hypothetical protein FRX94_04090 [Corynebacterium canis]|uniref:Uncharacterized protein n=1 Tax=Corynebacterium canis TaxID=679663 RepID=A0A5C5ULQ8_9CORY|nr:hypothetical protein FRX94_04090 [Corynebacterium canis]
MCGLLIPLCTLALGLIRRVLSFLFAFFFFAFLFLAGLLFFLGLVRIGLARGFLICVDVKVRAIGLGGFGLRGRRLRGGRLQQIQHAEQATAFANENGVAAVATGVTVVGVIIVDDDLVFGGLCRRRWRILWRSRVRFRFRLRLGSRRWHRLRLRLRLGLRLRLRFGLRLRVRLRGRWLRRGLSRGIRRRWIWSRRVWRRLIRGRRVRRRGIRRRRVRGGLRFRGRIGRLRLGARRGWPRRLGLRGLRVRRVRSGLARLRNVIVRAGLPTVVRIRIRGRGLRLWGRSLVVVRCGRGVDKRGRGGVARLLGSYGLTAGGLGLSGCAGVCDSSRNHRHSGGCADVIRLRPVQACRSIRRAGRNVCVRREKRVPTQGGNDRREVRCTWCGRHRRRGRWR